MAVTPPNLGPLTPLTVRLLLKPRPQVRATDTGRRQPNDRVGGLDELRILALLHTNVAGGVHHYSTHGVSVSLSCTGPRAGMSFRKARHPRPHDPSNPVSSAHWEGLTAPPSGEADAWRSAARTSPMTHHPELRHRCSQVSIRLAAGEELSER